MTSSDDNPYRSPQSLDADGAKTQGDPGDASQEQPVTVRFRWTAEEMASAYRYHFRHICRPLFRRSLEIILALVLLGVFFACWNSRSVNIIAGASILFGIYWFALRPFERRWTIRRQFAKRPDRDLEFVWRIAPDRIAVSSRLAQGEYAWEALTKVTRTPDGLMLYATDHIFHWLPRHGFACDDEFDRAVAIAKAKIRQFHTVS